MFDEDAVGGWYALDVVGQMGHKERVGNGNGHSKVIVLGI